MDSTRDDDSMRVQVIELEMVDHVIQNGRSPNSAFRTVVSASSSDAVFMPPRRVESLGDAPIPDPLPYRLESFCTSTTGESSEHMYHDYRDVHPSEFRKNLEELSVVEARQAEAAACMRSDPLVNDDDKDACSDLSMGNSSSSFPEQLAFFGSTQEHAIHRLYNNPRRWNPRKRPLLKISDEWSCNPHAIAAASLERRLSYTPPRNVRPKLPDGKNGVAKSCSSRKGSSAGDSSNGRQAGSVFERLYRNEPRPKSELMRLVRRANSNH